MSPPERRRQQAPWHDRDHRPAALLALELTAARGLGSHQTSGPIVALEGRRTPHSPSPSLQWCCAPPPSGHARCEAVVPVAMIVEADVYYRLGVEPLASAGLGGPTDSAVGLEVRGLLLQSTDDGRSWHCHLSTWRMLVGQACLHRPWTELSVVADDVPALMQKGYDHIDNSMAGLAPPWRQHQ